MKKIFIIGGMGAGKSTATHALASQGLPYIDLDKVGHEVLLWDIVKEELREEFGDEIFDENGEVIRQKLADVAFLTPASTRALNRISMPRIEQAYRERIDEIEATGAKAVVVEYSVYKNRSNSLAYDADVVIAVLAPLEERVKRAVAAGWSEEDVRRRMAEQITDAARAQEADVAFNNTGAPEDLANQVIAWWNDYKKTL